MVVSIPFKNAPINAIASGDRVAVGAVAGKRINVHGYVIRTDGTGGTFRWESSAGGNALSGVFIMPAAGLIILPFSEVPWFSTVSGEALLMEVGAGQIDGHVTYSETD